MRFIIADDSAFFRYYFKNQIITLGHTVVAEADSGKELIDLVKNIEADFVLTDIGMQPVTGLDASIEIINNFPNVKIICSTLQNINSWVGEMQLMGIKGYVYKNSGKNSLQNAINSSLNNEFYIDTQIIKTFIEDLKNIFQNKKSDLNNWHELQDEIRDIVTDTLPIKRLNDFLPCERDLIILNATMKGKPVKQIAEILGTTERNISKIKERMRDKIGVNTNAELLSVSHKMGWID